MIEYLGSKLLEYAARTSAEVEKPAGGTKGDALVCYGYAEKPTKALALTGSIDSIEGAVASSFHLGVFVLEHDGTASKPKLTWAGSESTGSVLGIELWRGVDLTHPFDVKGAINNPVAAESFTAESLNILSPGAMQIIVGANANGVNLKAPAGFTQRINYSPGTLSRQRAEAGETGTTKVELEGAPGVLGYAAFALRPSGLANPAAHRLSLLGVG